jgi:acyl transferase domain-containing protein
VDSGDQVRPDSVDAAAGPLRDTPQLLVFSANTQESLRRQVSHCKEYLKLHPERLIDLSYTLSQRREHLLHRAFSVVGAQPVTNTSSYTKLPANVPRIVMIFSGQGAQWPGMGKDLIQNDPGFQEDIRAMDDILQSLNYPPHWKVEGK